MEIISTNKKILNKQQFDAIYMYCMNTRKEIESSRSQWKKSLNRIPETKKADEYSDSTPHMLHAIDEEVSY